MIRRLTLLLILTIQSVYGQIQFDKTTYDFGELTLDTPRYIDFFLTNTGNKSQYILSVKQVSEVVYIQQRALILPKESIALRFQVNPKKRGSFNYEVDVFTSDKQTPTRIRLKGNLKIIPPKSDNNFTACPSFGNKPSNKNPLEFELTVITRDAETKELLGKSEVTLIQKGIEIARIKTNKAGKQALKINIGYTYFYAIHDGYFPTELGNYVNFQENQVVIDLYKNEVTTEVETADLTELKDTTYLIIENEIIDKTEEIKLEEETTEEINSPPITLAELPEDNFNSEYFLPTNVVFVIDVSSSMRGEDKLELMKYALYALTDMLRPQDRIGLVSYANNATVLLKPTSGQNKEEIKAIVKEMKAAGLTAGGAGIKLGYKQAKKNFISEGKNQVIIITDGGFNRNSGDYKKYIRKYKRKGITLSVVGIKNKDTAKEQMQNAAKIGAGRYVPIFGLEDAKHNLKEEIRKGAFKN
ncbi:MAG: VWA domain-containing protein [Lishizhenia sp.]